ncbi:hypothetical protein DFH05DRAFT_1495496 [Lentinula detonsa]|uniref:C2H2-type domain-containing protein n=1 Tax=Lentinula detonsa TaxID=2804962 RepID=A0A9W8P0N3_9AGAR|nr:hypothetical protein DFH05DRAFT_1497964 [Lentinula detonsa]KAJ3744517.1 hypothetical protein DFH05DRAFT_1495496 [Lentinula detonsa]
MMCKLAVYFMTRIACPYRGCTRTFALQGHLTKHVKSDTHQNGTLRQASSSSQAMAPALDYFDDCVHQSSFPDPQLEYHFHPFLNGEKCDQYGNTLPPGSPPAPSLQHENTWAPFADEVAFRLASLLFKKVEMSQPNINELLDLWCLDIQRRFNGDSAPFGNHQELLETIDSIQDGSAPWKCLETQIDESFLPDAPEWQKTSYQVWYRDPDMVIANILKNPDFANEFDPAPYVHVGRDGKRRWSNMMSGNFAYRQATKIYDDPETGGDKVLGAMYCPIILGADKTTVSVATGHVEYHPLYLSIGNLHNAARRGHRNSVVPIAFLAIPKADRKYDNDPKFRTFKKQLYQTSIAAILRSLVPGMTTPVLRRCPDGYYCHVIYDLAAFIADYPEQVLLAGVVQGWCCRCTAHFSDLDKPGEPRTREWVDTLFEHYQGEADVLWDNYGIDDDVLPFTHHFPRADIHEMLTADLLHQVVKGCFKDMLVEWVIAYLTITHGETQMKEIMDDVDHRISLVPPFPGLRHFPHGRRFKQWTGDDSKALMKVFLPAISEYIPEEMTKCLSSFLDFCYLARRNDFTTDTIAELQNALHSFCEYRKIFLRTNVRAHLSIPRMHSILHYPYLIINFGAPNGVCSSITESRHITAVKKPWRRSNRYNALSQMLLTNQRLDKLTMLRARLVEQGLMPPLQAPAPDPFETDKDDEGAVDADRLLAKVELAKTRARHYPRKLEDLAVYVNQPLLPELTRQFLFGQLSGEVADSIDIDLCPEIHAKINVYHSAIAMFYAPSDNAGIRGMHRERIRCTPSWYGHPRRDTVAVIIDEDEPGFRGMSAARALLFFSFTYKDSEYPCVLVHWYNTYGRSRDTRTSMWTVRPSYLDARQHRPHLAVLHLDSLLRGIHLIPIYGSRALPRSQGLAHYNSLDVFTAFYVNRFADYHSNEILF